MTHYENIENLISWLSAHSRVFEPYNLDAWLQELEKQYEASGSACYEIPARETFSGHPECYYYKVIDKFYCDGRELTDDEVNDGSDWDDTERTYVF